MTVPLGATTAITAATAAAAAATARRKKKEEEEMTPYTREDLAEGWEFKIVRSANMFKNPQKMRTALEEEARARWVLVEKFDDGRIRLKRPASAKESDANLDFDPYRTWVGISESRVVLFVLLAILFSIGLIVLIGILATR